MSSYQKMTEAESYKRAQELIRAIVVPDDDRASLVTQIAIDVGADIIVGVLQPGDDLNSVELARRYKTSRTPIREALLLLEKEGLVDIPPRRRPRVARKDLHTIRQIYRTRSAIMQFIARDLALEITEEQLGQLRAINETMELAIANDDYKLSLWTTVDFQDCILAISRNPIAARFVESLLLRTIVLRRHSMSVPGRAEMSREDQKRLIEAFASREPDLAAAIVASNHNSAYRNIEELIRKLDGDNPNVERALAAEAAPY